jgi:uncharacterized protein YidB (DUF937 family)
MLRSIATVSISGTLPEKLHASGLSPILRAWLSNFRNTGLAPRQCARGARIPYPSQLKD